MLKLILVAATALSLAACNYNKENYAANADYNAGEANYSEPAGGYNNATEYNAGNAANYSDNTANAADNGAAYNTTTNNAAGY